MHDLNRRLGLTFIFSTHDPRLLEHTDRIVRLCDGQVVSDTLTAKALPKEAAMGKFLLLAFRNIFRNRRRTMMTLIMVGGGVAGLLLAGGYFAFMTRGLRESTINNGLGHLQIFTADHFKRDEVRVLDTGIENWRQVAASVGLGSSTCAASRPASTSTAWFPTDQGRRVHGQRRRSGCRKEPRICHQCRLGQRSRPKPSGEVEALIGVGLAKSMNVKVGDGLDHPGHDLRRRAQRRRCSDRGHCQPRRSRAGCPLCAHHPARGPAPAAERSRHQPGGWPRFDR